MSLACVSATNETDALTQDDLLTADIPVDGDNASSIQKAIDDANAGDTINLGTNKTYNVDNQIIVYKQVTIKGDNVELKGKNVSLLTHQIPLFRV